MNKERGSAVGVVLLVLGVASIIGMAALMQSRLDLQMTAAMDQYNMLFGLADGASAIGFLRLAVGGHDLKFTGTETAKSLYADREESAAKDVGTYSVKLIMSGYSTDPDALAGWDLAKYAIENRISEGSSKRRPKSGPMTATIRAGISQVAIKQGVGD